jgi:hypothetical protein
MNSRNLSVSIAASPAAVYDFASNPMNLPKWAAGLAGTVKIEFAERNHLGVLDHVVTLPSGQKIMVPLRVNAKGEGSEVVFTLNQTPDMSDAQMAEDAKLVMKDLAALKKAIEG